MKDLDDNIICLQAKIAESDETSLAALYRLLNKKLLHFAKAILRSKENAEEIVEDAFVKLWCNRGKIMEIDNLTVYLYIAVKNRSLNFLSAKTKNLIIAPFDFLEIDMSEFSESPADIMISFEMMEQLKKAVDALPPRCKMVYKLIRDDGLKYKEVAEILNISVNTIDVQMAVAVKRICTCLQIEKTAKRK